MKELAICLLLNVACLGQSARQYYNELYKAGGLDRMADGYVCFSDDDKLETFFIFAESKWIREFMIADGSFGKMSKESQKKLKEDFLIVRGYDKGVAISADDFYNREGSSWVSDLSALSKQPKRFVRIRLDVTWETLRYKRSVEVFNADKILSGQIPGYGKCEQVSPEVRQHGNL